MSRLGYYTNRVRETRGLEHQLTLNNLRRYIRTTPKSELLSAIDMMSKPEHLKTLWEAGLTSDLQQAVLRRVEEITGRRE